MTTKSILITSIILISGCTQPDNRQSIDGITNEVEIVRDKWGVNHIYAQNQHDLFFAQGYAAAKDRLFQFEIWRRQATGTVAEILGPRELKRDIGTRLFMFRGDISEEMAHYHKDGVEIITAYTAGVNSFINEALLNPELLPLEFKILNIKPKLWTPEVVISRHQGLLGNINDELRIGRLVGAIGADKTKDLMWFHPKDPTIELDTSINADLLTDDILELYNAYRTSVKFKPEDIMAEYRAFSDNLDQDLYSANELDDRDFNIGSNNWVLSGNKTKDGNTYMANDPHRTIAIPSLRYITHLSAPGWDVIGGGEPEIPGISIGHNQHGAWGLTVFRTDGEDMYVYDLNPDNLLQYYYQGAWENMKTITEKISVKNQEDVEVDLNYTQHGPVTYIDSVNLKAYAIRCAWLEVGSSPYLASLRMDQATTWEEFRDACDYSFIPGENMIWADKEGNIGWQAVGLAPIRKNWSGLVPVPGDGRYEWDGYLPINQKPNVVNPESGFFATANQNVTPDDYTNWDAIGFSWADPYRGDRVNDVLSGSDDFSMADMKALQTDYYSLPAEKLVPLFLNLEVNNDKVKAAQNLLADWDFILDQNSTAAGVYFAVEKTLREAAHYHFVPDEAKQIINPTNIQLHTVLSWVTKPDERFGKPLNMARDTFLQEVLALAVKWLEDKVGSDPNDWQYGQIGYKHVYVTHPLSQAVDSETKQRLDAGPVPRGGNGYTPNSTSNNLNQSSGASFRILVNTGDWDATLATNPPGQSGDPASPFYKNLFNDWSNDEYFPLFYSKGKVDSVAVERTLLKPASN
ncbi:MAG: penicillin acylase family protein [Cyclobacteriaceae bacterium]